MLIGEDRRAYILAEWNGGRSLSAIAVELGISRERAGQLIGRLKGKERENLPIGEAARTLGIGPETVRRLIARAILKAGPGPTTTLVALQQALAIDRAPRRCQYCGREFVPSAAGRVNCEVHRGTPKLVRYAEWSQERRSRHVARTKAWTNMHRERVRLINKRAKFVYRLVQSGSDRATARLAARRRYPDSEEPKASVFAAAR